MCVIFLATKTRPTEEMIQRAWDHNRDGGGYAYQDGNEVVWRKGIKSADEMKELTKDLPFPYVMHFRIASVGGVKESLTHPFVVDKGATLQLEGRTRGAVLFHNGHWNNWSDRVLEAAIHANQKVPLGSDWSDTRAMAWMVHLYGAGFMNLLTEQKGIIMTPKEVEIFTGRGWDHINDVWCSNDYFWVGRGRSHSHGGFHQSFSGRLCVVGRCQNKAQAGKDMCVTCEAEKTPKIEQKTDEKSDMEDHALDIVTGGAKRPLARLFTLKEVESLVRGGHMSKSQGKKFRKLYPNLEKNGGKKERAKRELEQITRTVAERLANGLAL